MTMDRKPARQPTSGGLTAWPRRRPHRSTISLAPELRARLEARGARSDKGHGPYNYTRQLGRHLELFDSLVAKSDPRQTHAMPQGDYDLIIAVLTDAFVLVTFHITLLGDYLFELPAFRARAAELAIDPQELRDRVNDFPFAEKLHLTQAAQIHHAAGSSR
jgi:hypothetical protein